MEQIEAGTQLRESRHAAGLPDCPELVWVFSEIRQSRAAVAPPQEELMEVVDFFLKPERFRRSGARDAQAASSSAGRPAPARPRCLGPGAG